MNGIVLGVALLISSTGVSPAPETPRLAVSPLASSLAFPDHIAETPAQPHFRVDRHAPFGRTSSPAAPRLKAKRFSTTDRIIAVAAGVAVGWVAGGGIGYKLTANPSNPDDDMSGLRGVIIGAPLGAGVGAILGWRLTDR